MEKQSFIDQELPSLLKDIQNLGGGFNLNISQSQLFAYLPHEIESKNELLKIGMDLKTQRKVLQLKHQNLREDPSSVQKQSKQIINYKEITKIYSESNLHSSFHFDIVTQRKEDIEEEIFDEDLLEHWFAKGFNLNISLVNLENNEADAFNIFQMSLSILAELTHILDRDEITRLKIASVRYSQSINDSLNNETIEDLLLGKEIFKPKDALYMSLDAGFQQLKRLLNERKNQFITQNKALETEIVKIVFYDSSKSKAAEINLIEFMKDLFIAPDKQSNYTKRFENQLNNFLYIASQNKIISKEKLKGTQSKNTKLISFVEQNIFDAAQNIFILDFSGLQSQLNQNLTTYSQLQFRLEGFEKFSPITTLCQKMNKVLEKPTNIMEYASNRSSQQNSSFLSGQQTSLKQRYFQKFKVNNKS